MSRVLLVVILGVLLLLPAAADAAGSSDVVISQIYGGGGNAGATFRNDYVELFNTGSATIDLAGWTVQYATAAGATWQATALAGTIAPGRSYLVQLASNADVGAALPTADATGTSNLGAASGKIALVPGAAPLTCGASAGSCSGLVEDLVGYGDASDFEGSGSAAALSNTTAAVRANSGCTDTNDNTADFTAATPAPRNSASPAHLCGSVPSSGPNGSVNVDLNVASVLIVVEYLMAEAFPSGLYHFTASLWMVPVILVLWIFRIWLLAHRGELNDDPVSFALRDRTSLAFAGILVATFVLAAAI